MKNYIKNSITTFCILSLSISNSIAQSKISKEFNGISSIDISTISGSCEIIQSNDQTIYVSLEHQYKPANTFEPVFIQKNSVLLLKEKMHGSNSGHSRWILKVPERMDIKFESASGNMKVEGISGKIIMNTASGNITGKDIIILEDSKFISASGNVNIVLDKNPEFNLSVSSSSGNASLDFNQNPIVGKIEMRSRVTHGKIICPIKFDIEKEELVGNQKYRVKSFIAQREVPSIKIHTASGAAVLYE